MKYINASGGGGGGTGSDDVTALNKHVLEPYTAVTKESDDDPAKGTMKNLVDRATITHTSDNATKVLLADEAYIAENSDGVRRVELRYNGDEGFIKTNTLVAYPESQAGAKFGITADKIANGQVVLGMTGTYKGLGNATAAQVLSGYSFSSAALSNASGSMPDRGAWGATLAINGSVTIPAGYHNGSGRITQSIATKGATTITPMSAQQTAVSAGTYCSGNIIVAGNGNFVAGNIKKGVNIWGVVGTFEGWVPTPQDWYYNGVNTYGVDCNSAYFRFENTRIYCFSTSSSRVNSIQFRRAYNVQSYSRLNFNGHFISNAATIRVDLEGSNIGTTVTNVPNGAGSFSIDISQISSFSGSEALWIRDLKGGLFFNRISLS
uniref:Tail protein n=1 Tax=Myoviridae sp. ctgXL3 TaxID=2826681 RepID=A0A8S5QQZ9_9CAUD|nr:MAG TPA: tail protein [Myoviridae sp. ctgXL3]